MLAMTQPIELPNWLGTPIVEMPDEDKKKSNAQLVRESREKRFEIFFETQVLPQVENGVSINSVIKEDQRNYDYSGFLRWIDKDPERRSRLEEAQRIGTEVLLDECVDIADGVNDNGIPEDVQRSKLKIDARMFKIKNWNRKRYGDVKTIEINQQINVLQAQIDAGKMRVIEGKVIDHDLLEDE